jgi:hypothetical protein
LLVRLEDFSEFASLVAEREATRADDPTGVIAPPQHAPTTWSDPDDAQLAARPSWPSEDLRALAVGTSETAKRWALAMDACCAAVGTDHHWLSTSEVAARTGMTINEWRDAARKVTRHLKANYPNVPVGPNGAPIWPLLAKSKPGSQQVHWAMSPEQANRWRTVRGLQS